MFRATDEFDKALDKATSHLIMDPDWPTIMRLCHLIRQNDIQLKYALGAIRRKINASNQHSAMYALLVLESVIKNCGAPVHEELASRQFCETLVELVKTTQHEKVREKLLGLIQTWNHAFRKSLKYVALKDAVTALRADGHKFPALIESDAMFSADSALERLDGEVCHRCRTSFTLQQRKHHWPACGNVVCGQCYQKTSTIRRYGFESEVRVCGACYDSSSATGGALSTAKLDIESELPAKYLNSSLSQQSQQPKKRTTNEDELAKYLNRSYWESVFNKDGNEEAPMDAPTRVISLLAHEITPPITAPSTTSPKLRKEKGQESSDHDLEALICTRKSQHSDEEEPERDQPENLQVTDTNANSLSSVPITYATRPEGPFKKALLTTSTRNTHTSSIDKAVAAIEQLSNAHQSNEFTAFGHCVATQLQRLPLAVALQLQTDIQAQITRVRLHQFQESSAAPDAPVSMASNL